MQRPEPKDGVSPDWISERVARLKALLKENDYRGHDPFDLPNSPFLSWVPAGATLPQMLLSKFGSRIAPGWVRAALRVPTIEDPKIYSCSYFAHRFLGGADSDRVADEMLSRLSAMARRDDDGVYWGYDYTWGTRYDGVNPRGASTIVPGAFSMLALAHDVVCGSSRFGPMLDDAVSYYSTRHFRNGSGGPFLGYFTESTVNTHNANLLGCAAVSVGARLSGRHDQMRVAADAARTSLAAVAADGFIPYNDHPSGGWTDCFHHLYVVAALRLIRLANPLVEGDEFDAAIDRMMTYYRTQFRRSDGLLNYYPGRLHPIDPHNYAAVAIFQVLFDEDGSGIADARELLRRLDALSWDERKNRYRFRIFARRVDDRFFLRWTQVWMFLALATVSSVDRLRDQLANYERLFAE